MSSQGQGPSIRPMQRFQCEIGDPEEIPERATTGRLATKDRAGYPYIIPVNFVFHKDCVCFHWAPEGNKLRNIKRDPRVFFEVDESLAYLEVSFNPELSPPCRTHQFYRCVLIRGTGRVLPDGESRTEVLNALVAKHQKGRDFRKIIRPRQNESRRVRM